MNGRSHSLWLLLTAVALLGVIVRTADDLHLSQAERQGEGDWLTSLGLTVTGGGPLLDQPYAAPYTSRSFLAPTMTPPQDVTANALREDLPVLHAIMEKAYGGWTSAAKRGWDWNRWFADWDRALAAKGDTQLPVADAMAPLRALMDFQLDNHTGLTSGLRFGSGSRTAVLQSKPSGTCNEARTADGQTFPLDPADPAQRPIQTRVLTDAEREEDGYAIAYPARRGVAVSLQCGGKWLPVRVTDTSAREPLIAELAGAPAGEPSYRSVSATIGYLRLPSLTKANNEQLRRLLPRLPATAGHEALLIVDMRGNGGGDNVFDEMARWIEPSVSERGARFNRRQPKSCVYTALRWGYTQITSMSVTPPLTTELREAMQRQLDDLVAHPQDGCPVTLDEVRSAWDYRQHRVGSAPPRGRPRLLVLVDNGCGSDCELMAYAFAGEPGAIIAGENTFGVGQFIQPGYFILPRTRLGFRIALGMSDLYGDGRSFDGYGLAADIVLATHAAQSGPAIIRLAERWAARSR